MCGSCAKILIAPIVLGALQRPTVASCCLVVPSPWPRCVWALFSHLYLLVALSALPISMPGPIPQPFSLAQLLYPQYFGPPFFFFFNTQHVALSLAFRAMHGKGGPDSCPWRGVEGRSRFQPVSKCIYYNRYSRILFE